MLYERHILDSIKDQIHKGNKIIIVYGARQVGKTTLARQLIDALGCKTLMINADELKYTEVLSSRDADKLKGLLEGYELAFIDEAQRIPDIGINLKIIKDSIPDVQLLVTGSSSFELSNIIKEPLTGRTWSYVLYPVSLLELKTQYNTFELNNKLEELLIFGSYPEVLKTGSYAAKQKLLEEIGSAYLYKDILELLTLKNHIKLKNLLKLLAFQVGSEVSSNELSQNLGISRDAVERYLDMLEKSFIIFRLGGFSRNLRKEVSKSCKYYFYDLGIRNLIINNFNTLKNRNDTGALWENFVIIERIKTLHYKQVSFTPYFWRLYTGAEIDYIEERAGTVYGYEIKFSSKKPAAPKSWKATYPNAEYTVINRDNFLEKIFEF